MTVNRIIATNEQSAAASARVADLVFELAHMLAVMEDSSTANMIALIAGACVSIFASNDHKPLAADMLRASADYVETGSEEARRRIHDLSLQYALAHGVGDAPGERPS